MLKKLFNYRYSSIIIFTVIGAFFYILINKAINSPFSTIEEHYYLSLVNREKIDFMANREDVWFEKKHPNDIFSFNHGFIKMGRFVPILVSIMYIKAFLFPLNAYANHIFVFIIGVLSSFILYLIFRQLSISKTLSYIGSMLFLTGPHSIIWWKLSYSETYGTFFLLLSLLCYLKAIKSENNKWEILGSINLILSALCKESYVILIPIIGLLYLTFHSQQKLYSLREVVKNKLNFIIFQISTPFILISGIIFYLILNYKNEYNYGEVNSQWSLFINNAKWYLISYLPLFPAIFFLIIIYIKKNIARKYLFIYAALFLLWFCSQLIIYKNIIISSSQLRYLMPGALIIIISSILSIDLFKKQLKNKVFYYIFIGLISLIIVKNAKIAYINSSEYAAESTSFNKIVEYLVQKKPAKIAIYGGHEIVFSLKEFFYNSKYIPELLYVPFENEYNNNVITIVDSKGFNDKLNSFISRKFRLIYYNDFINDTTINTLFISTPKEYLNSKSNIFKNDLKKIEFKTEYNNLNIKDLIFNKKIAKNSVSFICLEK